MHAHINEVKDVHKWSNENCRICVHLLRSKLMRFLCNTSGSGVLHAAHIEN